MLLPIASIGQGTFTFVLGGGNWPGEIALYIVDSDNNIVTTLYETSGTDVILAEGCYSLVMTDSYGDGWNGNTYQVFDDGGNLLQSGDLDDAEGGNAFSVGIDEFCVTAPSCTDNEVNFFAGGGFYDGEIGWSITDEGGLLVASGTAPYAMTFCLPDGCYTLTMIDAFGDGWDGAVWYFSDMSGTVLDLGTLSSGAVGTQQVAIGSGSCPDPGPITYTPQDCGGAVTLCDDQTFGGNSNGFGAEQELNVFNRGCLSVEHQSSWYLFSPVTEGSIEFEITPGAGVDYDFAVWGPYDQPECVPNEPPIRCSYSDLFEPTGLTDTPGNQTSEGQNGNGWVEKIDVGAADLDKYYIMLVDNFSADNTSFDFGWSLNGVILNCAIALPIELVAFEGEALAQGHQLYWNTESELNNAYFEVQRSTDGDHWETLAQIGGQGNSNIPHAYSFRDENRLFGTSYYRLKQVDFNGQFEYSDWIALEHSSPFTIGNLYPNPTRDGSRLIVNSDQEVKAQIEIVSSHGRVIQRTIAECAKGTSVIQLDLSSALPGFYHIIVRDRNGTIIGTRSIQKS